jgi:hypothetical protein
MQPAHSLQKKKKNNMEQPYYRLRELIKAKYGEDKFSTGCQLVAQWLRHNTMTFFGSADIINICNLRSESFPLEEDHAKALRQLFGLKRNEELYTFPENTPPHLKTNQHANTDQ